MPFTSVMILIGVFAITGTPPFSIFASEFLILTSAVKSGHIWEAVFVIALLIMIFAGFIYHFSHMLMGEPEKAEKSESITMAIPMLILILVSISLGLFIPEKINLLLNQVEHILKQG